MIINFLSEPTGKHDNLICNALIEMDVRGFEMLLSEYYDRTQFVELIVKNFVLSSFVSNQKFNVNNKDQMNHNKKSSRQNKINYQDVEEDFDDDAIDSNEGQLQNEENNSNLLQESINEPYDKGKIGFKTKKYASVTSSLNEMNDDNNSKLNEMNENNKKDYKSRSFRSDSDPLHENSSKLRRNLKCVLFIFFLIFKI